MIHSDPKALAKPRTSRPTAAQAEPALSFRVSAGLVVVARPSNLLHR
jgi:hypothetical protein